MLGADPGAAALRHLATLMAADSRPAPAVAPPEMLPLRLRVLGPLGMTVLYEATCLAAIAAAVAWLYWRPLFEQGVWFPAGGGDLASLIYPNYRYAAESLRAGDIPFWNPYIQSGAPFAADIQSGLLYPINLVVFLISPRITYRVVEALALFHIWLAGALAYAAGRGLGLPRGAALIGGLAYALSDFFVVHVGNLNLMAVAAWLPLIVLVAHRLAVTPSIGWLGLGGLAVAMAALAGHIQPLLHGLLGVAALAGVHLWRLRDFRYVVALAGMVALGLAASAVQLIPAAELTASSVRAAINYERSTEYSLPPEQLISLLVPGFWGRGPDGYWGQWLRTEMGYAGILTLVLAGVALFAVRARLTYALVALALTGLFVALGGYTALHGLLYRFVPIFGSLRGPARAIVVFDLALALLAALGLAALLAMTDAERIDRALRFWRRFLIVAFVMAPMGLLGLVLLRDNPALPRATGIAEGWVMLAIWLAGGLLVLGGLRHGWVGPGLAAAAAAGWLTLDLVTNAQGLEQTRANPERGFDRPAILAYLAADPEPYRIDTDTGVWDVWQPNTAMVRRVSDVVGGIHPLELADFRRYWSGLGSRSTPLYDMLNARYLIGKKGVPLDRAKFELAFDDDPELSLFRNTRALPRAFLVGAATPARDHDHAYELIHAPDFDARAAVVLEGVAGGGTPGAAGTARLARYRTSSLAVEVAPTAPGWLVLSEVWYPGWSATVDGRPAAVVRANFLFRAVAVSPGDRTVDLTFEPSDWRLSLGVSALAWLVIASTLARWIARTRSAPGSPSA